MEEEKKKKPPLPPMLKMAAANVKRRNKVYPNTSISPMMDVEEVFDGVQRVAGVLLDDDQEVIRFVPILNRDSIELILLRLIQ